MRPPVKHVKDHRQILIVHSNLREGLELARAWIDRGAEATVVTTVAQARTRAANRRQDRGVFALDLPDGSGITLAASLIADERIVEVEFVVDPHKVERPGVTRTPDGGASGAAIV